MNKPKFNLTIPDFLEIKIKKKFLLTEGESFKQKIKENFHFQNDVEIHENDEETQLLFSNVYTQEELDSLGELLKRYCKKFSISAEYR